MGRFVFSKKGRIPVVIGSGDQGTEEKNKGEGAAGVLILGPAEKSNSINPEQGKKLGRPVSMDNWHSTEPARSVEGSERFERRSKAAMAYDSSVGAIIMSITLLCFLFYGPVCSILFTCAWLYLLPLFREGSERMREMKKNNDIRTAYLQSTEYKEKVIMDGFLNRN